MKPSPSSSLVRMEARGLATVDDYWYELLKLPLTITVNFISVWTMSYCKLANPLRLLFNIYWLLQLSTVQFFLGCNFKASVQKALLCSTGLIPWLLLDEQSCDTLVFWFWFLLLFAAQWQRPEAPWGLLHRQSPGLLRPLLKGRWSSQSACSHWTTCNTLDHIPGAQTSLRRVKRHLPWCPQSPTHPASGLPATESFSSGSIIKAAADVVLPVGTASLCRRVTVIS